MAADTNGYISRGNMNVMISAAVLVVMVAGGFFTFLISAVDGRINDLKSEVRGFDAIYLRKDEHIEFKARLDKDIGLIRDEQLRRGAAIVPRTEHEARWAATDDNIRRAVAREAEDFKLFSDRLNEVRSTTSGTVTLRDEIKRLQDDIAEMRRHQMRDGAK